MEQPTGEPSTSRERRLSLLGILLILLVALATLAFVVVRNALPAWQSLGRPPEAALAIVAVEKSVWVAGASGRTYTYRGGLWLAEAVPDPDASAWPDHVPCQPLVTLAGAIDQQSICYSAGDSIAIKVYALKADGEVFVWKQEPAFIFAFLEAILLVSPIAIVAGLVIAFILLLAVRSQAPSRL